jgi:hypothetical protein
MKPEHRYMVAFMAGSLKAGRTFTHVYDHDAAREIAVGGVVAPDRIDIIEGDAHARISGAPDALWHGASESWIQLKLEEGGFAGYDYGSAQHFEGVFSGALPGAAIQIYDHETGRYHAFHVS